MDWVPVTLTFYLVVFVNLGCGNGIIHNCPCQNQSLCAPISRNASEGNEIFIFSLTNKSDVWQSYDWSKITTVVMVGYMSLDLMCLAHNHNARAVIIANYPTSQLLNFTERDIWIKKQLQTTQDNFLDGINIDYEDAIPKGSTTLRDAYTDLVYKTFTNFKKANKNYQVTVDVAWSPAGIDQRVYDYLALSTVTDFLFVMSYDEQSQIHGECVAGANSGFEKTYSGLVDYFLLPVPPNKLVLGIPWYGYVYPCVELSEDGKVCEIKHVPFRGVNCSDAAGKQYNFSYITQILLRNSSTGRKWDVHTLSPWFNFNQNGQTYQVWYDDPESLSAKYKMAVNMGLRGVGMWNADAVDYKLDPQGTKMMWDALPEYL